MNDNNENLEFDNEMDDNKLTVEFNGTKLTIEVIDIIENDENGKKYIIYTVDGADDNVYTSILEEDETTFSLKSIDDEQEAKELEEYLEALSYDDVEEGI